MQKAALSGRAHRRSRCSPRPVRRSLPALRSFPRVVSSSTKALRSTEHRPTQLLRVDLLWSPIAEVPRAYSRRDDRYAPHDHSSIELSGGLARRRERDLSVAPSEGEGRAAPPGAARETDIRTFSHCSIGHSVE